MNFPFASPSIDYVFQFTIASYIYINVFLHKAKSLEAELFYNIYIKAI